MATSLDERAAVLALTAATPGDWFPTADLVSVVGSALAVLDRRLPPLPPPQARLAGRLAEAVSEADLEGAGETIASAERRGARLVTVLDEDYPINLRQVFNRPPFLWIRGRLLRSDTKAVAVVGTRQATEEGLARAADMARGLADTGVTVISGLAAGIDTATHTACLAAGGRTVAVIGTGIHQAPFPAANRALDAQIERDGAVVSQFWPDAPGSRRSFPLRNVVMSGLSLGTVVIEASQTSGAKMQARFALEHGRRLYLLDTLVESQEWAKRYAARPDVAVVTSPADVLADVQSLGRPAVQSTLAF